MEGLIGKPCRKAAQGARLKSGGFCQGDPRFQADSQLYRERRVSRQTVSSIENGKYNPSLELAFAIADFFGKTIEEIFIYKGGGEDGK